MRIEDALRRSGASVDEIKAQALRERAKITRKRYASLLRKRPTRDKE